MRYQTEEGFSAAESVAVGADRMTYAVSPLAKDYEGIADGGQAETVGGVIYYPVRANGWGTLMFEDLWPAYGDYDFNDLVLNYKIQLYMNNKNMVDAMLIGIRAVSYTHLSPGRIKTSRMLEKIKKNPRFKHFLIGLISSHKNPRPRLWVRWFVNPFVHKKGRGAVVRSRRSRHDLFPWHRFEVGRGALVEQFTVLNNGAGDILIGAGARVGIGSVVIGPVRMGERAGLGQHVFCLLYTSPRSVLT